MAGTLARWIGTFAVSADVQWAWPQSSTGTFAVAQAEPRTWKPRSASQMAIWSRSVRWYRISYRSNSRPDHSATVDGQTDSSACWMGELESEGARLDRRGSETAQVLLSFSVSIKRWSWIASGNGVAGHRRCPFRRAFPRDSVYVAFGKQSPFRRLARHSDHISTESTRRTESNARRTQCGSIDSWNCCRLRGSATVAYPT